MSNAKPEDPVELRELLTISRRAKNTQKRRAKRAERERDAARRDLAGARALLRSIHENRTMRNYDSSMHDRIYAFLHDHEEPVPSATRSRAVAPDDGASQDHGQPGGGSSSPTREMGPWDRFAPGDNLERSGLRWRPFMGDEETER